MTHKAKIKVGPVLGSALALALGGVAACSDSFSADDCVVTHTCAPRDDGDAGAAGSDSGASDAGAAGAPSDATSSGGAGGTAETPSIGGANAAGGAATDGCAYESCECEEGDTRACGPEVERGICKPGTQTCAEGAWGECVDAVEAQPRDCTSELDNDCDGKADNVIDEACKCVPGTKEACGEHAGLDGNGPCQAGERTCTGSGSSGIWGACVGAVGPKTSDRCDKKDDDSNCDGEPNGGCTCLEGEKTICGDVYTATQGVCTAISLTCSSTGKWPSSTTCATTATEVCDEAHKDENCNGVVDEDCDCPEASNLPGYDPALIGMCCRGSTGVGYMVQSVADPIYMLCALTDLAQGKTASTDSEADNFPASNATDASLTSLWKAKDTDNDHWIKIDLGEAIYITSVVFKFEAPGTYGYKLETSATGAAWVAKGSGTSAANATSQGRSFSKTLTRYLRITFTSLPAGKSAALSSVRVH